MSNIDAANFAAAARGLPSRFSVGREAASVLVGRVVGGNVDLDQLEVVGIEGDVMPHAGRLAEAGAGGDGDLVAARATPRQAA